MVSEFERALDALHHIDAGCTRDDWVRTGMAAKSARLSFDDFHKWSAPAGNYAGENDCRTVWRSFAESGAVTSATLFQMAYAQGWKDPGKSNKQSASTNVLDIWERCTFATATEPYIDRKQGKSDGLRVYPANVPPLVIRGQNVAGYLVVPCWNDNNLQTLQFIPPDGGDKLNLAGASFGDGFFTVGEVTDRVYICEGIGQSWAINQATEAAAAVCFGAGRMGKVAKVIRGKYPAARLVIVPDRGKEEQAAKIAAAVAGQWIELPDDKPLNYDCNDFAQEFGTSALSDLLKRL